MSKKVILFLLSVVLMFFAGCADKIVTECDTPPVGNNIPQLTTLSKIQNDLFTPSCALAGCHGSDSPQAGLNLSDGQSYSNLINVTSVLYPQYKRVLPGSASQSLLIKVLKGEGVSQMPPSGKVNNSLIDSVAAWIDRGAPVN